MLHQVWRLSEPGNDNLGLACDERGLVLGRTPLIERRDGRFRVMQARSNACSTGPTAARYHSNASCLGLPRWLTR